METEKITNVYTFFSGYCLCLPVASAVNADIFYFLTLSSC